ncbi:YybS family protein [Domibacillus indicus]|uniref:YybS family protein n=1 Tax=Domibacillus indicus TaxID=1437523 RepID=UPI0018CD92F4|nr:YybS family protein [Domibacillus indicus]
MRRTNAITEGAMMLAIFTVLLMVSVYVPIVSIAGALFLLLPFLIYSAKYPAGPALGLLAGAVAVSFIAGGVVSVPIAVMYGTTGVVMGNMIRRQSEGWIVYMAGSLVFLMNIVIQYVGAVLLFDISFLSEFGRTFKQSMLETSSMLGQELPYSEDEIDSVIQYVGALLPTVFVLAAFVAVLLLMLVNYPILKRLRIEVKPLQPFRTVRLPRSILWYYLLFMAGALFARPETGTAWYDVYVNAMFILQACLYIHGLSFVFDFAYSKKWPKAVPVILAVLSILFVPLLYLIRLLGIIDLGFDLRQRMQKKP